MQKTKDNNLIVFKPKRQNFHELEEKTRAGITVFSGQIFAYRNCRLVDVQSGNVLLCDILVKDEKIFKIVLHDDETSREQFSDCECIDCRFCLVIPPFYNAFYDSVKAFEKSFDVRVDEDLKPLVQDLMGLQCSLKGVIYVNDISKGEGLLLDNFVEQSEQQLGEFCNLAAKTGEKLFMKVGQDLQELGAVDKQYKKPLAYVLEDFGFLDRNSPVVVGGNCFEKDDLQIFANYDTSFVVCPSEDARFGRRPTNLISLKNHGFDVGLGSGYAFEVDFFALMRQILQAQRGMFEDEECICEKDVFVMALAGVYRSREQCSMEEVVSLKEGDFANFVLLSDIGLPAKGVYESDLYSNIFKALVWGKSSDDILMSVGNGRILQKGGLCQSLTSGLTYEEMAIKIAEEIKLRRKQK